MRGADVTAGVSAAALWGEHGSLPRGGGCVLGPALADEAARGALLRQGNAWGRPLPRSPGAGGRISGVRSCQRSAAPAATSQRCCGAPRPFPPRGCGAAFPTAPRSAPSGRGSAGRRVPLPSAWSSRAFPPGWGQRVPGAHPPDLLPRGRGVGAGAAAAEQPAPSRRWEWAPVGRGAGAGRERAPSGVYNLAVLGKTAVLCVVFANNP